MPFRRPDDKPKPTIEDMRQKHVTEAIVAAGIRSLRPLAKSGRAVASLNKAEVEDFAWAVIVAFLDERRKLEIAEELNDDLPPNMLGTA